MAKRPSSPRGRRSDDFQVGEKPRDDYSVISGDTTSKFPNAPVALRRASFFTVRYIVAAFLVFILVVNCIILLIFQKQTIGELQARNAELEQAELNLQFICKNSSSWDKQCGRYR